MEDSLSNFDISSSTVQVNLDSSSDDSDKFDELLDTVLVPTTSANVVEEEKGDGDGDSEDFDNNLPETVTLLRHPVNGAKVYLIGTAHFSKQSQDEVVKVMQEVKPHVVMLELCESRVTLLTMDEDTMLKESQKINLENIRNLIKRNGLYCGITYVLILNLNSHLTKEIGMAPGGEFRVAYQEAMKLKNCSVILGDRPIRTTLMRALSKLTWFQTIRLAFNLLFSKESIKKEDVENCKRRDMLEELLAEMTGQYPALGEVFVNERDIFLTHSLQDAATNHHGYAINPPNLQEGEPLRVVGVVGIGHVVGITKLWPYNQAPNIPAIMIIPPPTLTSKVLKFTIKWSFYALVGYVAFKYVPVPKTLRSGCKAGLQSMADRSFTAVQYVSDTFRTSYLSIMRR